MFKVMLLAAVAGIAGCTSTIAASGQPELMGAWTVEYIGERPVIDNSPAFIEFAEEGRAGGNASCNRFTGVLRAFRLQYELQQYGFHQENVFSPP